MTEGHFAPIKTAHAINELMFFIEFAPSTFKSVSQAISKLTSALAAEFPRINPIQVVEINTNAAAQVQQGGVELRRFKTDGTVEWLLRFTAENLSIHSMDYSRWAEIWPLIDDFLVKIFRAINEVPSVTSAGIKCIDQFKFRGAPSSYAADALLSRRSKYLHPMAFESGTRWHCHSGHFVTDTDFGEILSQLNVGSGEFITQPEASFSSTGNTPTLVREILVTIDHTLICRSISAVMRALVEPADAPTRRLFADRLHEMNKAVVADLLVESMSKRIQLTTNGSV